MAATVTQIALTVLSLRIISCSGIVIPVNSRSSVTKYVQSYEQIGGSIEVNPFPRPTIVKSIRLEEVQIQPDVFHDMLSNCLEVEGFHFKPYDVQAKNGAAEANPDEFTFDLSIVSTMKNHHFDHFILDGVTVSFSANAAPINADLLVTFFQSKLPSDFATQMTTQFPAVNTLNLVEVVIDGDGKGIRASDLEYLISGQIPSLRHMFIRGLNWNVEPGRLAALLASLGCSTDTREYVFLDKDYDFWEC